MNTICEPKTSQFGSKCSPDWAIMLPDSDKCSPDLAIMLQDNDKCSPDWAIMLPDSSWLSYNATRQW